MNALLRHFVFFNFLLASVSLFASNLPGYLLNQPIRLMNGETVNLADYQGKKPVYLKFWATWCQPCREQMLHFQEVQQRYGDEIVVIGVNIDMNDNQQAVQKMINNFSLTMPTAIDSNGDLAQAFHLLGTPYHLLFDRHSNLVHLGHEANKQLDNKLLLVSQAGTVDQLDSSSLLETAPALSLPIDDGRTHALFFTATWCDWYLAESRPKIASECATAQRKINSLVQQYPQIVWHGIVSRLWTAKKDITEYREKFSVNHDLSIDQRNEWFHRYGVKGFPTLVLIDNGEEIYRKEGDFNITDFPIK